MDIKERLFDLCRLNGPSGFEEPVSAYCAEILKKYSEDVRVDRLGNVLAAIPCGKAGAKKVLLDAHIDEVGLIVSAVEQGFLRFETLGGIDPRMLPGREVTILTEPPLFGVVACLPPHVLTPEQMEKTIAVKDMYIDTGLPEEEAKKQIPIGTPGVYRDEPRELENHILCGKALDDRSCFVVLIQALDKLKGKNLEVDLFVAASVQEEVFMRGAGPLAYTTAPDYCIVVDVTHAATPDSKGQITGKLGGGPVFSIGPNTDRRFTRFIQDTARLRSIPYQLEVHTRSSGTNAYPIQVSHGGVITAIVGLPLRYMHSPVECVKQEDIEKAADLLAAVLETMPGEAV
jgi:endoglucanase